jgi:hypothetical protein
MGISSLRRLHLERNIPVTRVFFNTTLSVKNCFDNNGIYTVLYSIYIQYKKTDTGTIPSVVIFVLDKLKEIHALQTLRKWANVICVIGNNVCMIASSYEMKRSGTLHFSIGDDLLGRFKIIFGGKEGISLRPNVYHTILICISNHAFLICFKYKCHIINILLTSLARYVQRNIGPRSFFTNLALRARSVQKRPRSDISLYRLRVRLIKSY